MTDENPSAPLTDAPQEQAPIESQPSSNDGAPADPPHASAAAEGVAALPPGVPVPPEATTPSPAETPAPILIETPVQGAALERGDAIMPPAEAQPIVALADVAKILGALDSPEPGVPAGADAGFPDAPAEDVPQEPNQYGEHPHLTLDRLRTKLSAYGVECLKTVEAEVNYLYTLCDPPG